MARHFKDWRPALLGVVFLVASPRIFADSFYNPKDAVFLSFYTIAGCTLANLLRRPTVAGAALHGLACACAISSRVVGLILPAITIILLIATSIRSRKFTFAPFAIFCFACLSFTYIFWPALWADPVGGIRAVAHQAARFTWKLEVLYAGKFYAATDLPWHYLPIWIGLTTPPLYLVLMLAGLVVMVRRRLSVGEDGLMLLLGVGPLVGAIIGSDVNYDGWRHLYFVYPFLVAVAVVGLVAIFEAIPEKGWGRAVVVTLVTVSLIRTATFMACAHPNQQVYFNAMAGRDAHLRYDADYWGLSYKQALEEILRRDDRPAIRVTAANYPGLANVEMLPKYDRARVQFVIEPKEAEYYMTNFRGREELAALAEKRPPFDHEVFVLSTKRTAIVGVYRMP
jgi:hypothetical protein